MEEDIANVGKAIGEYQKDIEKKNFANKLNGLVEDANLQRLTEPRSAETRYWAVVHTDLERVLAYVFKYLGA